MDSNGTWWLVRNSLVLRQLEHPGAQYTLKPSAMFHSFCMRARIRDAPTIPPVKQRGVLRQFHAFITPTPVQSHDFYQTVGSQFGI